MLTTAANLAIAASAVPGALAWWRATRNVREAQERLWARLRDRNRDCAYGRRHGFARRPSLANVASWPTMSGRDLAGARGGAEFTSDPILRHVPTSGTSGARKDVPYTAELLTEFQAGLDPWLLSMYRRHPRLLGGRAYWQITPAVRSSGGGDPDDSGDDTEYLGRFRAAIARRAMAVPGDVGAAASLEDFQHRTLAHLVARRDLAFVSVWNPTFLSLLLDALPSRVGALEAELRAHGRHARARALRDTFAAWSGDPGERDARGRTWPERLWPHLALVSCWADANAAATARELQRRLPNVAIEPKGLLATEGIVTFPWRLGLHPLAVTSHVFEFVPDDAASGRALLAHELALGGRYRVLLTTGGGLWRYELGDVVEVTGFVNECPALRLAGRYDGVVDLVGEKLSPIQVQDAVRVALEAEGGVHAARFWMLAPLTAPGGARGYALFVQAAAGGALDAARFAGRVERALHANPHYTYARTLGQLEALRSFVIDPAADPAACWLRRASSDRRLGSLKPPALDPRTDWADVFPGAFAATPAEPAIR